MTRRSLYALLLLCCLWAALAQAKHVYSWRDENGVLHFSDQRPGTTQEVRATPVKVDPRDWVSLRDERRGDFNRHHLRSLYGGPIEVELSLVNAHNTVTDPPLPHRFVIPAFAEHPLFTAGAMQPGRYSYEYSYRHVPGSPHAQVDLEHVYRLPFRSERRLLIAQGFNGSFSHRDEYSRHAIDIGMPEGTPILAARGGVVMQIEEDFDGGGTDQARYGDRANYLRILHADGSMAVYAHLRLESVRVSLGQSIHAGQQIAESGNTGFSTGPHLHFVVQRNTGMRVVSVPFKLELQGGPAQPQEGQILEP